MPAYSVYRPSVMRSGRLAVRAAAVAALLAAAVVAFTVVTHSGGKASPSAAKVTHSTGAPAAKLKAAALPKTKTKTVAKTHTAKRAVTPRTTPLHAVKKTHRTVVPAPSHTPVAVLNGGTSHGAAAAIASHLQALGYPVPVVGNAGRRDLPSAIEYSDGFGAAARALAKHLGPVKYITPFDGPVRNLSGAHLLVIIGD
jgi:hypothetical protein